MKFTRELRYQLFSKPWTWIAIGCLMLPALACGLPDVAAPTMTPAAASPTTGSFASTAVRQATPTARPAVLPPTNTPKAAISLTPIRASEPVWVANETDGTVLRIDSATNTVVKTIHVGGSPRQVLDANGSIWVLDSLQQQVLRIDPGSNQVIATIPVSQGVPLRLASAGGSIWVGTMDKVDVGKLPVGIDFNVPGGVARLNPALNKISAFTKFNGIVHYLGANQKGLWVLSNGYGFNEFAQLDPDTGKELMLSGNSDPNPKISPDVGLMAAGQPSYVWLVDYGAKNLHRYNPDLAKVDQDVTFSAGGKDAIQMAMTADEQYVWVAMSDGSLARVNPGTGQAITIFLGSAVDELFYAGDSLWGYSHSQATLIRIDPQAGKLVTSIPTGSLPPTPTPRPATTSPWKPCGSAYPASQLHVGDKAYVSYDPPVANRVRSGASSSAEILGYIQPGEQVTVLDGPDCANNWVWWKIQSLKSGLTGWTAEGDGGSYWLQPLP